MNKLAWQRLGGFFLLYFLVLGAANTAIWIYGVNQGWKLFSEGNAIYPLLIQTTLFVSGLFAAGLSFWRTHEQQRANDRGDNTARHDQFNQGVELLASDSTLKWAAGADMVQQAAQLVPELKQRGIVVLASFLAQQFANANDGLIVADGDGVATYGSAKYEEVSSTEAAILHGLRAYGTLAADGPIRTVSNLHFCKVNLGGVSLTSIACQKCLFVNAFFKIQSAKDLRLSGFLGDKLIFQGTTFENVHLDLSVPQALQSHTFGRIRLTECSGEVVINGIVVSPNPNGETNVIIDNDGNTRIVGER